MEDVYMTQPVGFADIKNANKVCKLLKIHLWNETSFKELESLF